MSDYVERVRNARHNPSVLKAKVFLVRSSKPEVPIIIVEGKGDIGPYEVWIKRINDKLQLHLLPGAGKEQLIRFRAGLADQKERGNKIYFVLDKDFDGLRGRPNGEDVFCTQFYSFENYLITGQVLRSVLEDEFETADDPALTESVVKLFEEVIDQFCEAMCEANFRLFMANKLGIRIAGKEERIRKYVSLAWDRATKIYDDTLLAELIPLAEDPSVEQRERIKTKFEELGDPKESHRGKFLLAFFRAWIDELVSKRKDGTGVFHGKKKSIRFGTSSMTARSLASRAAYPEGLEAFILKIVGN